MVNVVRFFPVLGVRAMDDSSLSSCSDLCVIGEDCDTHGHSSRISCYK